MKIIETSLRGVLIIEPVVFGDERGFFMESFNHKKYNEAIGHEFSFVQDNHSHSIKGVFRGLHYQLPPKIQGKLVRVLTGCIFDVAVDIRKNSFQYGRWVGVELSAENRKQLWIPPGFAHGFITLSETADVLYKVTDYYDPLLERVILWDDKDISINFPDYFEHNSVILSDKDMFKAKALNEAEVFI